MQPTKDRVRTGLRVLALAAAFGAGTAGAWAQSMTTAAEIKPILTVTKAQWVAVRPYEGRDLLYFTNLLSWRCGLDHIYYSVNGGEEAEFVAEPCYEDTAQPNALKAESLDAILVPFELDSVQTVDVRIVYDDDTEDTVNYERAAIQIN
ncbi:hypothetical protein [Celeribacter sp.]|uniref:hypothetical protein n=1 Tax=Celeribacter sp. TaxID=1890673 RepID=UPI003A928B26